MNDSLVSPLLQVENIGRQENGRTVLHSISFTQLVGERIAIAGATGSGKSTVLKTIAGLVQPDEGRILFENIPVKGPEEKLLPGHSSIAYLSQHFELRSHYRVEEVLAMTSKVSDAQAEELYALCLIEGFLKRWTHELSGGERQRVALAQRLVMAPKLLLLDEPWSNLDFTHKQLLKKVISEAGNKLGLSCILVSHDPADLLPWADKILVLKDGAVIQEATAQTIYYKPVDQYVAGLFGPYNLLNPLLQQRFGLVVSEENVFIRPDQLQLSKKRGAIQAVVSQISLAGGYSVVTLIAFEEQLLVNTVDRNWAPGERVYVSLAG